MPTPTSDSSMPYLRFGVFAVVAGAAALVLLAAANKGAGGGLTCFRRS
ncbi:MAG: hypothetical protein K2W96_04190 [Gemmataceae bacterium]|nr:hypothetical protein [Gemmataceae bacterium]